MKDGLAEETHPVDAFYRLDGELKTAARVDKKDMMDLRCDRTDCVRAPHFGQVENGGRFTRRRPLCSHRQHERARLRPPEDRGIDGSTAGIRER